jgi:hypothetical protein
MVFAARERPWVINFYGSISALEAEKQRTNADAMNGGLLLVQALAQLKDIGASKEVASEFLSKTMKLDQGQAELYASVMEAKPPEDGGGPDGSGFGAAPP